MHDPDAGLLAAAQAGDQDAFVALLERHARHMLGIAGGVTGDPDLARRAVERAACAAWAERAGARPAAEPWLGRLARRHALLLARETA